MFVSVVIIVVAVMITTLVSLRRPHAVAQSELHGAATVFRVQERVQVNCALITVILLLFAGSEIV